MELSKRKLILRQILPTDEKVKILVQKLNEYQISLYGMENCNLESPESLQENNAIMVGAYINKILVGIGAVKLYDSYGEIKRMFIEEKYRGRAIGEHILNYLEKYASQQGKHKICLETGNLHTAALRFYKRLGYYEIEKFGDYQPNNVSVYFEKIIATDRVIISTNQ